MESNRVMLIAISITLIQLLGALPEKSYGQSPSQPAFELGHNQYPDKVTGSSDYFERSYEGAPPMIPHSIDDMAINLEAVACLGCHQAGIKFSDGHTATKVPASHYKNEYTDVVSEEISGIRRNCLQRHLIQSDEEPPSLQME